jgi:hypothetical protein
MSTEFVVRVQLVEAPEADEMRVSPRMANVLRRAAEIGRTPTGSPLVSTESLLRALLEDPDGIAAKLLKEWSAGASTRRRAIAR